MPRGDRTGPGGQGPGTGRGMGRSGAGRGQSGGGRGQGGGFAAGPTVLKEQPINWGPPVTSSNALNAELL